jgi:hypothetical protein
MNTGIMNLTSRLSTASIVGASLALAAAVGGLGGCASSSDAASAPRTPVAQAAAIARSECAGYHADPQIADILNGSLVEGAGPLYAGVESNRSHRRLEGAAIRVRPIKGASAEWLARELTCHAAERTLAQGSSDAVARDPFAPSSGVPEIRVISARDAFEVEVIAPTTTDAAEVLARARALAGNSGLAQASGATSRAMAIDNLP